MKKDRLLGFTRVLYGIYMMATIVVLVMVFNKIDGRIGFNFLGGYIFLTFFMLIYVPVITVVNSRKLKWIDIRKRILKFTGLFILFACLNYGFDYLFRREAITLLRIFSNSVGLAFGLAFMDVIFLKRAVTKK